SSTSPCFMRCESPMKVPLSSYTITRRLNVWNSRRPSCHRLCLRLRSRVKRQTCLTTGAVVRVRTFCEVNMAANRGVRDGGTHALGKSVRTPVDKTSLSRRVYTSWLQSYTTTERVTECA